MGISAPPQGRRPEDLGPQQISESRFIHAVNKASSELNLRMAGGAKWPPLPHPLSMVQSDVKRFGICGYAIHYGNKLFE